MKTKMYLSTLFVLMVFVVIGCWPFGPDNSPPEISNLTADPPSVQVGGSSDLTCTASDPDGDNLTYSWEASSGSISGSGSSRTWTAPVTEGTYTVSCTVDDGHEGKDTEEIDLPVENPLGSLQISSTPSGARIFMDEQDTGYITPHTLEELPIGFHTVKLILEGYDDWGPQSIEIIANQATTITAVFLNNPPVITSLGANPPSVQIGGACILTCSASDEDGDSLTYSWEASSGSISGSGSSITWTAPVTEGTYTVSCTVDDGRGGKDTGEIDLTVENSLGSLQVSSTPSGASILLDEQDTGYNTPHTLEELPIGFHTVKLILEGYADWGPQSIEIIANQTRTITATLGHTLGLILLPEAQYASLAIGAPTGDIGTLPASVDLEDYIPQPGDQGSQGSCTAWAVAYAVKSYHECVERHWSLYDASHLMSPAFIFNQIKVGDCKTGSYIRDALNLLQTKGCASLAAMPYNSFDCNTQPSSAAYQEAFEYRIKSWSRTNQGSIQEMKGFLANDKQPIIIATKVLTDLVTLDENNPIYDDDSGSNRGYHAIALIGYDDASQAFKFINSWGTDWGIDGYGWISYDIVLSVVVESYVAYDVIERGTAPELTNGAVSPSSGSSSTTFTYLVDYFDQDQDSPTEIKVYIDGVGHDMHLASGQDWSGTYQFQTTLEEASHIYYFWTNDGTFYDRLPAGVISGPQVSDNIIIEINPVSWDYGIKNVGGYSSKIFSVTNSSSSTTNLKVTSQSVTGTNASEFSIESGGGAFDLTPGSQHTTTLRFSPSSLGTKNAAFRIVNNSENAPTLDVPLEGLGAGPIEVTNPIGETVWTTGDQNVSIKWETGALGGNVKIQLCKDYEFERDIVSSTLNGGEYNQWDVPTNLEPRDDYRVLVYFDDDYRDYSNKFKIVKILDGYANKDAYVDENAPNSKYGNQTTFVVGESDDSPYKDRFVLLDFDFIRNDIPSNAKCVSATLRLAVFQGGSEKGTPFETVVDMIKSDWDENEVTWNYDPGCLNHLADVTIPSGDDNGYNSFDITYPVSQAIRYTGDSTLPYKGFRIRPSGDSRDKEKWFYSTENENAKRPYLEVIYYID